MVLSVFFVWSCRKVNEKKGRKRKGGGRHKPRPHFNPKDIANWPLGGKGGGRKRGKKGKKRAVGGCAKCLLELERKGKGKGRGKKKGRGRPSAGKRLQ